MDFLFNTLLGKMTLTFFMSMIPVIELRGAIPVGTGMGLNLWLAIVISIIGNMVPVPFIIIFIRKIFEWLRVKNERLNSLVVRMEQRADKHKDVVNRYKFWGLFILVAIPLPGTGAWTGALVAAMLEMRLKDAVPAIFLGVVSAGIIVAAVTYGAFNIF